MKILLCLLGAIPFLCVSCSESEPVDLPKNTPEVPVTITPPDPDNPNSVVGPMEAISEIPYGSIPAKEYVIDLVKWDIPSNRSNPVKTTDNLQKAINWAKEQGFGKIILPKGHYLIGKEGNEIYQAGISLKSNMALLLDKDATIEMAKNNKWNYCAISVRNLQHVVISGGTVIGDRDNHIYTPRKDGATAHDEGHLICIEGESQFVTIENTVLAKANGDGILTVGSKKGEPQKLTDVVIRNNNFADNRRQGISIVGGKNILVEKNEIHHTKGTEPQFGIDLEGAGRINRDIIIRNNYLHHNTGGDIVNTDGRNVLVEGNILTQGEGSRYIDGPLVYWDKADMTIQNNNITMLTTSVNNWNGIIQYSRGNLEANLNTTYILNNVCNSCGFYMYRGADLVIKNNYLKRGHLVFKEMDNLILENNKVEHPSKCWAYRFLEVTGDASGNTYNGKPFEIPLEEDEPYDGCWIN